LFDAPFFFNAMLSHPEPLGWQIDDLASLWHIGWAGAQVPLTVLAPLHGMYEHHMMYVAFYNV
jgi:hypothetical protein